MKFLVCGFSFLWLWAIQAEAKTLSVASFSTVLSDAAQNVGQDKIQLISVVKPGIDPHEFQPTPTDIQQVTQADIVLLSGKGMEGYLTKLEMSAPHAKFIPVGDAFPSLILEEDGKKIEDPHWWHDITKVEKATEIIRDALGQADPAHAADYQKNAASYEAKLQALEVWAKEKITSLPREKRKLVTSHDAFQYFAREFGFQIYAIEGVSPEEEPSSQKVAHLIALIQQQGVKAVFFESIENPKVITEITRETGAKIGGELYADGLGNKEATTYIDMMHHNLNIIVDSLK